MSALQNLKVVFMGTPDFAVPPLQKMLECGVQVVAVVTGADKPAGRGLQLASSAVKKIAQQHGLKILQPEKLNDPDFVQSLQALNANAFIVVAFRILPREVFTIPAHGTINIHASLLPKYRGAAPIQWAIINGESETGVTTFLITDKVDTGNILLQARTPIGPDETLGELHDRLSHLGAELLLTTLEQIQHGGLRPQPQQGAVTLAPKITNAVAEIDWRKPAREIRNLIRGLNPAPGAFTYWQGKMLKIFRARAIETEDGNLAPGVIHRVEAKPGNLFVGTGKGLLALEELQLPGKRIVNVSNFLQGHKISVMEQLGR